VHAKIYRELRSPACQREMCTLLPTLSYQHDLIVCLTDAHRLCPRLARRGDPIATDACQLISCGLAQLDTMHEFGKQRLDELEAVALGSLEANKYDPLYNNARANIGARSTLGQYLTDSASDRRHPALIGASARHTVKDLTAKLDKQARTRDKPMPPTQQYRQQQQRQRQQQQQQQQQQTRQQQQLPPDPEGGAAAGGGGRDGKGRGGPGRGGGGRGRGGA
jgi:hypothetical protein